MSMASQTTLDMSVLNQLFARLDIDSVFTEPALQQPALSAVPACYSTTTTHSALHPSLSLPLTESFYPDLSSPDVSLPPLSKSGERRALSITDSTSWSLVGPEVQQKQQGAARYKTELCRPFEENGTCRYGSKCQFAHGRTELRSLVRHPKYKTDLCRTFHTTGLCPYGPRCHFIHNDDERSPDDVVDQSGVIVRSVQPPRDDGGRRLSSVQETRGSRGLHRQYSEYLPARHQRPVVATGSIGSGGSELQRRASSVADSVIRHPIASQYHHHQQHQQQQQLLSLLDSEGLNGVASTPSLGSVADSFSPASSITDSPSPSPTCGLQLVPPPPVDCSTPTGDDGPAQPLMAQGWLGSDDGERVLLAELVSRLQPHDVAALLRALQNQQAAASPGAMPPGQMPTLAALRSLEDDARFASLWSDPHFLHQYQQQPQQQHSTPPSSVCW